jgi:hypothetical protein
MFNAVGIWAGNSTPFSDVDSSCEYAEQAVADSRQGVVLQLKGCGKERG